MHSIKERIYQKKYGGSYREGYTFDTSNSEAFIACIAGATHYLMEIHPVGANIVNDGREILTLRKGQTNLH